MDEPLVKELEELLLTCEICNEEAFDGGTDYHILQCQHTICEACVKRMVEKRRNRQPLLCPWCREEFTLPESGKLPTFRLAKDLSAQLKAYASKKKQIKKKVKTKPVQQEVQGGNKKKPMQLMLLRKYSENSCHLFYCPGKHGVFYCQPHCRDGLSYINVLEEGKVHRFGHLQSVYSDVVFSGDELFAVNLTQGYIEVYQEQKMVRSWYFGKGTLFYGNMHAKISLCKENRITIIQVDNNHNITMTHFSKFGRRLNICNVEPYVCELLLNNDALTSYRGSTWVANKDDKHLWEIPMEQTFDRVRYKSPIRHLKIGEHTSVCSWQTDKILYTSGNFVKIIDLAAVDNHRAAATSDRRQQYNTTTDIKPGVSKVFSSVCQDSSQITVSKDGYVVMLEEDSAAVYKLIQAEDKMPTVNEVTLDGSVIPGPEYQTYDQQLNSIWESLQQRICSFIYDILRTLLMIVCFLTIMANFRPDLYSNITSKFDKLVNATITYVCTHELHFHGGTFGWSNLYVSYCEEPPPNYRCTL